MPKLVKLASWSTLVLDAAFRVRRVVIITNKLDLLPTSTPRAKRLILPPSPLDNTGDDERNEQDAASRGQGDDRDQQILLLSLEVRQLLLRIRVRVVAPVRDRVPDIRSRDALNGEERWVSGVNRTHRIVALGKDPVDEEVRDDVLGAGGLLGETGMTKAVLLDEDSAVVQVFSDDEGVSEGGRRISLVPDDDDRVFQRVVPWTGEPLNSTSGPSVAVMGGLWELAAN